MAEEKNQKAEITIEEQTNCPACGKPIKKIKRYYRNGKFYCNKKCFLKVKKSKEGQRQ